MATERRICLFLIFALGSFLRFYELGETALWCDEALLSCWMREGHYVQEYPLVFIGHLFGFESEFWLRSTSAFFGSLTILATYFVVEKRKLIASSIVAFFPLFVFWSRMNRPYAMAGFFMVIGWRYWWFYIIALLTTPLAIVGIRIKKLWLIGVLLVIAIIVYFLRPDFNRNWTFEQVLHSSRWFYEVGLAFILYSFNVLLPYLDKRYTKRKDKLVQSRGKI